MVGVPNGPGALHRSPVHHCTSTLLVSPVARRRATGAPVRALRRKQVRPLWSSTRPWARQKAARGSVRGSDTGGSLAAAAGCRITIKPTRAPPWQDPMLPMRSPAGCRPSPAHSRLPRGVACSSSSPAPSSPPGGAPWRRCCGSWGWARPRPSPTTTGCSTGTAGRAAPPPGACCTSCSPPSPRRGRW